MARLVEAGSWGAEGSGSASVRGFAWVNLVPCSLCWVPWPGVVCQGFSFPLPFPELLSSSKLLSWLGSLKSHGARSGPCATSGRTRGSTECGPCTQLAESERAGGRVVRGAADVADPGSWRAEGSRWYAAFLSCMKGGETVKQGHWKNKNKKTPAVKSIRFRFV